MSGPVVSAGNNQYGTINVNGSLLGGFITTYGSVTGNITVNGPVSGPVVSASNNQNGTININAPVQGGSLITGGADAGNITIGGPLNGPVVSGANNQNGTIKLVVPLQGGQIVSVGNITGPININGAVQGGAIASSAMIMGNLTIGGPLSGQIVSVGNITGNVTIKGPLQSGRIATLGSILGNLSVGGPIDSQSAITAGGSIGNNNNANGPPTTFSSGDIQGIVAAVGSINVGKIGKTSHALDYESNLNASSPDAAVIDAIFLGITPLSPADLFDQTTLLDLNNLSLILTNMNLLSVQNGKLVIPNH